MNRKKEIEQTILQMSGDRSPYNVFEDWVECMALSISNACQMIHDKVYQDRERKFAAIVQQYKKPPVEKFAEMFVMLSETLESGISDILGEIYMEMELGNKNTGQFFTPYHVSFMCAEASLQLYKGDHILPIFEPSCGGGGMIIATAAVLSERGMNYQKLMYVVAQDLDWKAVHMTYVMLSLMGINAVVAQGNTLTEMYCPGYPKDRVFRTPANKGALI